MSQSRLMQGSVLLEGLLAVLIFSVGVLALSPSSWHMTPV